MPEREPLYRVELEKEQLVFSAAHFITFGGGICERLHGHNYGLRATVWGPLDENAYVIDFIALRDELQKIAAELDHHVLLPDRHPQIKVQVDGEEVVATFESRRWVFPREDCVLLPVANTTAELLAKFIGQRLLEALAARDLHPQRVEIGVDENRGQWGVWDSGPRESP